MGNNFFKGVITLKKLFLYISFFAFIFWSAFLLFRDYYQKHTHIKATKDYVEYHFSSLKEFAEQVAVFADGTVAKKDCEDLIENNPVQENLVNNDDMEEYIVSDAEVEATDVFIVGFRNDHVVIFKNDTDCIYEYTDIDQNIVSLLHGDIYNDLMNNIRFSNLEDAYKFLESISS